MTIDKSNNFGGEEMASQADVTLKNEFPRGTIRVFRKIDRHTDLEYAVESGSYHRIPLMGPESSLIIQAPEGKDTKYSIIKMRSDVDVMLQNTRTNAQWEISIIPNHLPPDVPTIINISVGEEEPD
jgi:hypothetical protein